MIILNAVLIRTCRALTPLSPTNVEIADYTEHDGSKPEILVRVVTDSFENIRKKNREKIAKETLLKNDPAIYDTFSVTCECFTEREYRLFALKNRWQH